MLDFVANFNLIEVVLHIDNTVILHFIIATFSMTRYLVLNTVSMVESLNWVNFKLYVIDLQHDVTKIKVNTIECKYEQILLNSICFERTSSAVRTE